MDLVRKNKITALILFKMIHYYENLLLLINIYRETSSNARLLQNFSSAQYILNLFTVKLKYFSNLKVSLYSFKYF